MIDAEVMALFMKAPQVLPLYEAFAEAVVALGEVSVKVSRTQVSFSNRYGFAYAWPPARRMKGWPKEFLGVTFGLGHQVVHARIVQSVEAYPGRWTHHVLVTRAEEIDEELMGWVKEAYAFSMMKRAHGGLASPLRNPPGPGA